jgi:hypothetical protein
LTELLDGRRFTDVGRSLSISRRPDCFIGICLIGSCWLRDSLILSERERADSSSINAASFHPHAPHNAFRRRDVRLESTLFARENRRLTFLHCSQARLFKLDSRKLFFFFLQPYRSWSPKYKGKGLRDA